MKLRFSLTSLFILAIVTILYGPGARAYSETITSDINFSCSDGSGNLAGKFTTGTKSNKVSSTAVCSGSTLRLSKASAGNALTTWSQSWSGDGYSGAYNIAATNVIYNTHAGETSNQSHSNLTQTGSGDPSLISYKAGAVSTITVTDSGREFWFDSVDLATNVKSSAFSYTIDGYLGNILEFAETCSGTKCVSKADYYFTVYGNTDDITELVITLDPAHNGEVWLDNLDLSTSAPEPVSLVLMGSGMLAMALVLRRRKARVIPLASNLPSPTP